MTDKKNKGFDEAWPDERLAFFDGVDNELRKLREERSDLKEKRLALVGAWNNAKEINDIIVSQGLKLSIIADNNPNKQGVSRLGIISQSVESLTSEDNIVILVVSIWYWKEIRAQLLRMGFKENEDFYVLMGEREVEKRDDEGRHVLSDETWEQYKERAQKGYASYLRIAEKYPGKPIWLMHQPSLGDLFIFSMFLPYEMGVSSIAECDCVLIVTKNSVRKLAQLIGYRYIEMITFEEAYSDWLMLKRLMDDELPIFNAVYHGENKLFQTLVHFTQVSFCDSFTKYVFRFPEEVKPIYPRLPGRKDHVTEQFAEYGLIPGKTVVISPYAGHFEAHITMEQWERLAEALKIKGYTVCSNCGGPAEKPIPGTAAPFIELQDCQHFVETAGYFLGVRSGFCDLVCMADCHKAVIYESGAPAGSIDYFGFDSMGLGEDILEYVNDCIHTDDMIEEILAQY